MMGLARQVIIQITILITVTAVNLSVLISLNQDLIEEKNHGRRRLNGFEDSPIEIILIIQNCVKQRK